MSKQTIWNKLKSLGYSDNASAALMGNWDAESGNESCRLQGDFTTDRSLSTTYANNVNKGLGNFVYDSQGWGLAQWTYWSRKRELQDYCKSKKVGIENENAQVEFANKELKEQYASVYSTLKSNTTLHSMVSKVCTDYERPAYNNIEARYASAQQILAQFKGTSGVEPTSDESVVLNEDKAVFNSFVYPEMPLLKLGDKGIPVGMVQFALAKHGYGIAYDCDLGNMTFNAIRQFQSNNGITVSGTVDKATWEALYK